MPLCVLSGDIRSRGVRRRDLWPVTRGAGCERPSEGRGSCRAARSPVARVEVVQPERRTVRRTVGEPGSSRRSRPPRSMRGSPATSRAGRSTSGASVKKGQILAELSVPELEAELRQKQAAIEQAIGRSQAGRGRGRGGPGRHRRLRGEARRGPGRHPPGRRRNRPLGRRAGPRRAALRGAGADRHPAGRDPEQAPIGRGDPRGGPRPGEIGRGRA